MCDPLKRPFTWNKKFYVYAERHGLYDVVQSLMKELAIWKPEDPLQYIMDEIRRIGTSIYAPKVFMLGPEPLTPLLAEGVANHCGAKYFTLKSIIQNTTPDIRAHLQSFLRGGDSNDEHQRKLLIATIARRLVGPDCVKCGYVLYGFPQSRAQALMAQGCGLIPKQVFVLLPEGPPDSNPRRKSGTPGSANSVDFTDIFSAEKLKAQYTTAQIEFYKEYFGIKDTATAYSPDTLKVQSFSHWNTMDPVDLEAEFLGVLITKPNTGAPWIPRILFIGPPSAGKRTVAEKLGAKYKVAVFGWIDIIRGALAYEDDIADECTMYLDDLTPLSDECVAALLKRRLYRDDCMKKGFVLFGFPETANQAIVMDNVALTPNRIFLLSCPEAMSMTRIAKKKKIIMARPVPKHPLFYKSDTMIGVDADAGEGGPSILEEERETFGQNPYTDEAISAKYDYYTNNLPGVLHHFGSSTIYVDASEDLNVVMDFVLSCTLRPPNIRFD